jgi:hypothetical protein
MTGTTIAASFSKENSRQVVRAIVDLLEHGQDQVKLPAALSREWDCLFHGAHERQDEREKAKDGE